MKSKILKICIATILILTMTMTNFVFVGAGLVTYAAEDVSTNNKNVEFEIGFEDENGNKSDNLEREFSNVDTYLYIKINVKKEGYFNGNISLENNNFILKDYESDFINKIDGNTIYLNQINAGTTAEIKIKIEPIKDEFYDIGLLDCVTTAKINGIYRDSSQKDIEITSKREIKLKMTESNTGDSVLNEIKLITNKIQKIDGEEKRVVQFSWNMGLKENNYPISEIQSTLNLPEINGEFPEVVKVVNVNNINKWDYKYENGVVTFNMKNEANDQNKVNWKTYGNENVILTCIYSKDANIKDARISSEEKVYLYDKAELSLKVNMSFIDENIDETIAIKSSNNETSIFKGKIYSKIDRQYVTDTYVDVNFAKPIDYIKVVENQPVYTNGENQQSANVVYNKTIISKEEFTKVLGDNGSVEIYNQNNESLAKITKDSQVDENGNFVIDYTGKEPSALQIRLSTPTSEGELKFKHTKTIKASEADIVKSATQIETNITAEYNMEGNESFTEGSKKETVSKIDLQESKTEARIETNKDTLSTVTKNDLQIKAILKTNSEQYELFKNPTLTIELPEQVESAEVSSVDILYGNGLELKNYEINGRNIKIYLQGEQTAYNEETVEGTNIIVNLTASVNKKSATSEEKINLTYSNEKAVNYENNGSASTNIKIVAPKDITAINSIEELSIETFGQEDSKDVMLERGVKEKQSEVKSEIINNADSAIENVKVLGTLVTDSNKNNMGATVIEGLTAETANVKIYYTENENAKEDLNNKDNGWTDSLDISKAKKYLVQIDNIDVGQSVVLKHKIKIPANLEYNKEATIGYKVIYTNSQTKVSGEIKATDLKLQTGIGPNIETKLTGFIGGKEATGTVRNGEVIKYRVEVSNTGTADTGNISIKSNIPEGTVLVEPEENFEYTGVSYYKELDNKTYETTIENLKSGESIYKEFEVRVKTDTVAGTNLVNKAEVDYGDTSKQTNEITYTTAGATLRATVKQVTDTRLEITEGGVVQYYAIIENISNERQDNVKVRTNIPEGVTVERTMLITGMKKNDVSDDDLYEPGSGKTTNEEPREITEEELTIQENELKTEEIEYNDEIDIGSLEPGENKVISYDITINKLTNSDRMYSDVIALDKQNTEYRSNSLQSTVNKTSILLNMTATPDNKYVKTRDQIEYTITVENKSSSKTSGLTISDNVPSQLTINKVTVDGQDMGQVQGNNLKISCDIAAGQTTTIKILTTVDYSADRDESEAITNVATAERYGEEIARTSEISHIIQSNDGNVDEGDNNVPDNDIAQGNRTITGVAWYDENANGQKDSNESTLSNIKVRLLNVETNNLVRDINGNTLEVTTNENGVYILDKIGNGKYIVVFDYDTTKYGITKYKVEGVSETNNSDVMLSDLTINGETKNVAATDILEIKDGNISDINLGLIQLKNYDLKLDKYVSKIVIQDSNGTTVKEYDNETTAKFELDAKKLNGTNVIIEYKIVVTNNGEVAGYARKIADYMSTELKFTSELNKDWYQVGNTIYSTKLANEIINPGETKEITLTLTKVMNENNTGLIPNTAEIAEDYNELGLLDSNSTPENNLNGENDMGMAEVIISIRTGAVLYTTIAIIIVAILAVVAVVIIKKKKQLGDK